MAGKAIAGKVAMSIDPAVRASPGYRAGAVRRQPRRSCAAPANVPRLARAGRRQAMQTDNRLFDDLARVATSAIGSLQSARGEGREQDPAAVRARRRIDGPRFRARSSDAVKAMARKARLENDKLAKRVAELGGQARGGSQAGAARLDGRRRRGGQVGGGQGEAQGNRREGRRRRQVGDSQAAGGDERGAAARHRRSPPAGARGRPRPAEGLACARLLC